MNLVVGDILKEHEGMFYQTVEDALDIARWFNSHGRVREALGEVQKSIYQKTVAIIFPCLTRWTTHYQAVRRMLSIKTAFQAMFLDRPKLHTLASTSPRNNTATKADEVFDKAIRPGFWDDLARYVLGDDHTYCTKFFDSVEMHLRPLVAATNILQSDHANLSTVVLALASLYRIFLKNRSFQLSVCRTVL